LGLFMAVSMSLASSGLRAGFTSRILSKVGVVWFIIGNEIFVGGDSGLGGEAMGWFTDEFENCFSSSWVFKLGGAKLMVVLGDSSSILTSLSLIDDSSLRDEAGRFGIFSKGATCSGCRLD